MRKIRIRKHEFGLWFRHGDFKALLDPGKRWMWMSLRDKVQIMNTMNTKFEHELLDVLVGEADLRAKLEVVELNDTQRAIVWKDDRLAYIVGPGRHAFWTKPYKLKVEVFDITNVKFDHPRMDAIVNFPGASRLIDGVRADAHEDVLLFIDGKFVEKLGPGMHTFWRGAGNVTWKAIDRREQIADVAGQEIMTNDKVTLRMNLVVTYVVTDPVKAVTEVTDHAQALYREAQLVLRAAVGGRKLDALLTDKESVGNEVRDVLARRADQFGVAVRNVGLRDIILPGDMKMILNQVIEAEKQAQANLIRRREETAAARSQANTAKLLADNPVLARMKEMEALAEILAGADTKFVFGNGNVSEQIRSLIADEK